MMTNRINASLSFRAFAMVSFIAALIGGAWLCLPSSAFAAPSDAQSQPTLAAAQITAGATDMALQSFDDDEAPVPDGAVDLQLGEFETSTLEGGASTRWFAFSPSESGAYAFESAGIVQTDEDGETYEETYGDMFGALYELSGDRLALVATDDDSGASGNFAIVSNLEQGKQYYLACSSYTDDEVAFRVRVTAFEFDVSNLSAYTAEYKSVLFTSEAESAQALTDSIAVQLRTPLGEIADLEAGTDYSVTWFVDEWNEDEEGDEYAERVPLGFPAEPGDYVAVIEGMNSYTGSLSAFVSLLDGFDISNYGVDYQAEILGVDGDLEAFVRALGIRFIDPRGNGEDCADMQVGAECELAGFYEIDENGDLGNPIEGVPKASGDYAAVLIGIGEYGGALQLPFYYCSPNDISRYYADCIDQVSASQAASEQALIDALAISLVSPYADDATVGLDQLKVAGWYRDGEEGGSGQIAFPAAAGDYHVVLEGSGLYTGSMQLHFTIYDDNDLGFYAVDGAGRVTTAVDSEDALVQALGLSFALPNDGGALSLQYGTDYRAAGWYRSSDYEWGDDSEEGKLQSFPTQADEYVVELEGIGDYSGTAVYAFEMREANDISFAEMSSQDIVSSDDATAAGSLIEALGITLSNPVGAGNLTLGVDYAVKGIYSDAGDDFESEPISYPAQPGYYYVTLEGIGSYSGTVDVFFTVSKLVSLEDATIEGVEDEYVYDGTPIEVHPRVVTSAGDAVDEGVQCFIEVQDIEAGNASVDLITKPGTYRVQVIGIEEAGFAGSCFKDFTVKAEEVEEGFTVMWTNGDGEMLKSVDGVTDDAALVYDGETPSKAADEQYTYEFSGWNRIASDVSDDVTYMAMYTAHIREYQIQWKNDDGSLIETTTVAYGEIPQHDPLTKEEDELCVYEFEGWSPAPSMVVGDAEYVAVFKRIEKPAPTPEGGKDESDESNGSGESPKVSQKKGTVLKAGASSYVVTKAGAKPEVQFSKAGASSSVSVPATIAADGVTYKVTSIAAYAFKGNKKLKKVVVGNNIVSIGKGAFQKCPKLKTVILGTGVKTVGKKAFAGDKKLKTITIKSGKLAKSAAKNILKGSKIKKVKLSGKAAKAKKKAYKKYFGKKVSVK